MTLDGRPPQLPDLLARIAETCGRDAALAFAARFGGRELYIPRPESIGEDHPIAQTVGLARGRKLAQVLGSHALMVPLGPAASWQRWRESIRTLKGQGLSNSAIARNLGVHLRTVERHVSPTTREEPYQPGLFGD